VGGTPLPDPLPYVTVQLPLFNERYVAARLVRAVATLDYPADRLEIQVLDDSTDDTAEIVGGVVAELRAQGVRVTHCAERRGQEQGGALAEGLATASGEFIAIFDADFVPRRDFLRAALPHFRSASPSCRRGGPSQPLVLRAHNRAVARHGRPLRRRTVGPLLERLLLNFNGTAGVWRRAAILDAGAGPTTRSPRTST